MLLLFVGIVCERRLSLLFCISYFNTGGSIETTIRTALFHLEEIGLLWLRDVGAEVFLLKAVLSHEFSPADDALKLQFRRLLDKFINVI